MNNGEFEFEDGGLGPHCNPTREAILDVVEEGKWESIGNVVSIGTSRKRAPEGSTAIPTVKKIIDKAASPEVVEGPVEQMSTSEDHPFNYWRFNAGGTHPHALAVQFDEWEPRSASSRSVAGASTINKIRTSFERWLNETRNWEALRDCAARLVETKRLRAEQTPYKWERFVTGHSFTCRQPQCPHHESRDPTFDYRDVFENHLIGEHRFRRTSPELLREIKKCRRQWEYVPRR